MGYLEKLKLSTYTWDCGKHPHGFQSFMEDFSSLVRQVEGGDVLEEFLDQELLRKHAQSKRKPQWLASDPDFQVDDTDGAEFEPAGNMENVADNAEAAGAEEEAPHGETYDEAYAEAMRLVEEAWQPVVSPCSEWRLGAGGPHTHPPLRRPCHHRGPSAAPAMESWLALSVCGRARLEWRS